MSGLPKSEAQINEPEKPTRFAQSTFCLNVSSSSNEIHWSVSQDIYLTAASLSWTTLTPGFF